MRVSLFSFSSSLPRKLIIYRQFATSSPRPSKTDRVTQTLQNSTQSSPEGEDVFADPTPPSEISDTKPQSTWTGLPPGQFVDKKVVITGASRGIGAEIARRFAAEGATCVLVGRNEELLERVRDGLRGVGHRVNVGDVGNVEFWKRMKKEKDIDVLINAAGVTHYSPLVVTAPELLEEVMRTNLMGTMLGCRAVGKLMMGSPTGGCIINVASLLGLKGGKGSAAYAASKAGVISLTRALAAELGPRHVRVNVIAPGYIETDMTAAMTPEARSQALDAIPLKRFGHASEIAEAAVFLAANKYANNCVLNLDGGLSAV